MAEDKKPKAQRYDREVRRVAFKTENNYRDVKLGDLRQVVAAAEGMGDDAEVTVEGLSKHYSRVDEWRLRCVRVTEEVVIPAVTVQGENREEQDRG